MTSEITNQNVTKTVDNLGIETSRRYAEAEQLRLETDKYIKQTKYGRVPTERETIQTTPTKEQELLGIIAQGRFSTFLDPQKILTRVTALSEGRFIASVGEGEALKKAVNNAPEDLKSDSENYLKMANFAEMYLRGDRNCSDIAGRSKQYNKG